MKTSLVKGYLQQHNKIKNCHTSQSKLPTQLKIIKLLNINLGKNVKENLSI